MTMADLTSRQLQWDTLKEHIPDERVANLILDRLVKDCAANFLPTYEKEYSGKKYKILSTEFLMNLVDHTHFTVYMYTKIIVDNKHIISITNSVECVP